MIEEVDKVRILISTCNQKQPLQRTLDSIRLQTYGEDNIEVIIVDFGSDEEMYLWMLNYPMKHLAIYRKDSRIREALDYYTANLLSIMSSRIHNKYILELCPGDIINPEYIQKCITLMNQYKNQEVGGIICEAMLEDEEGVVKRQNPLFDKDRIITRNDRLEYLTRGATHRILYFDKRKEMDAGANFDGWLYYDPHYWTYRFTQGNNENMLYLHDEGGSIYTESINCNNILQKMIATYVSILQFIRTYENSETDRINLKEQTQIYINFAYLSLIMACECAKQGEDKAAEDCCLFSKVIYLPISETNLYNEIYRMLGTKDQNAWKKMIDIIVSEREGGKNDE